MTEQGVLDTFAAFYYGEPKPVKIAAPRLRVPYFQLRFSNGYVTGIVATRRLDRFLSYGVNIGQFRRGRWYRVPASAARELRTLTGSLKPLALTRAAVAKSH